MNFLCDLFLSGRKGLNVKFNDKIFLSFKKIQHDVSFKFLQQQKNS